MNEKTVDLLAVNINPREADLKQLDLSQLASKLGIDNINKLEQNSQLANSIAIYRVGKELWHIFLWTALILIILELIISRGNPAGKQS